MHRLGLHRRIGCISSRERQIIFNQLRKSSVVVSSDGTLPEPTGTPAPPTAIPSLESLTRGPGAPKAHGSFFVDYVMPARYANWDIRYYISPISEQNMSSRLESLFNQTSIHNFKVLAIEPTPKDGGMFVHFGYTPEHATNNEQALEDINSKAKNIISKEGGIPTWFYIGRGSFFMVRGKPWNEDLSRFPSNILKIEFEGPDVHQELLYEILRPYGRITDMTKPQPVPAGTLRSTTVTFARVRSAVVARNCLHGLAVSDHTLSSSGTTGAPTKTRLSFAYERPIKVHAIRDWLTSHPRIVLPVVIFLLGTLTYTIFDPIRAFAVQAKIMDWFDYRQWRVVRFLRRNTVDKLTFNVKSGLVAGGASSTAQANAASSTSTTSESSEEKSPPSTTLTGPVAPGPSEWKERQEAEQALHAYFAEMPNTIAVLHGPQGSGKSKMLAHILEQEDRKTLEIDCAEIYKASTDTGLVDALAKQTGYWPVFSFLASANNMIDLAAVGVIGQKAGLSSSLDQQLKQILEVVGGALKQVSLDIIKDAKAKEERAKRNRERAGQSWLGSITGTEKTNVTAGVPLPMVTPWTEEDIDALPIVIIRNFAIKNAGNREILLTVLADWAAALVDNKVAHVLVLTDNRENMRRLAKALPARPLASIPLADADPASALSFVRAKMMDISLAQEPIELSPNDISYVEKLGGRASDLDVLVHKVRNGSTIQEAVQDIVARGVGELRKVAFAEDAEDAKNMPWSREQAWGIIKQLAKTEELPYAEVLLDFPFKGDEAALRGMEHAELITITTLDGLPIGIRPGRPVYKYVFQRLVDQPVFFAVQDISYNLKAIAAEEKTIKDCEQELIVLRSIGLDTGSTLFSFSTGAAAARASFLLSKMKASEDKLEELEKRNKGLKKVLSKGVQT